jgi:SOS-response transcriptional repressor LexA
MKSVYSKWISEGIKKKGKSAVGLAAYLTKALKLKTPMHRGTIYKMINGKRKVFVEEFAPISEYIEEPVPSQIPIGDLLTLKIEKEVTAGVWIEQGTEQKPLGSIVTPRDFAYPTAVHRAFRVGGDSMMKAGILDGDTVLCVEPEEGNKIEDGKWVIVERTRAGLVETSARILHTYNDRTEFVSADGESQKPVIVRGGKRGHDNEQVRVVAIIRRIIRNAP